MKKIMNLESVSFCVIHAPKIHVENLSSSSKYREKEKLSQKTRGKIISKFGQEAKNPGNISHISPCKK